MTEEQMLKIVQGAELEYYENRKRYFVHIKDKVILIQMFGKSVVRIKYINELNQVEEICDQSKFEEFLVWWTLLNG